MSRSERSYYGPRPVYGPHAGKTSMMLGFLFFGSLIVGSDVLLDTSMIGVRHSDSAIFDERMHFGDDVTPEYEAADDRDKVTSTFVKPPEKVINGGDGVVGYMFGRKVKITPIGGSDCLADTPYDLTQNSDVRVTKADEGIIIVTPPKSEITPLRLDLNNGQYGFMSPEDEPTLDYLRSRNCPPSVLNYFDF